MKRKILSLDQAIAALALIGGFSLTALSVGMGHYGVILPAVVILSSSIYLVFRNRLVKGITLSSSSISKNWELISHLIYLVSISASVWLLWSQLYYRPLLYFITVIVAAGSIVFSIVRMGPPRTMSITIILLKIIILAGSIYAGKYYEFYGIYGIDPWWHNIAIQQTIDLGHINGSYIFESYYYEFPLFHILGSITQIISGLPVYTSIFVSVGFSLCLSCLFIFLICKRRFDAKTSLLATLIIPLSAYAIQMSSAIIPMSLGYFFFLVVLYLLSYPERGRVQNSLLFILISSALILTHTIASIITLLTLVAFYVSFKIFKFWQKEYSEQPPVSLYLVILFGAAMFWRWIQVAPNGESFFASMFNNLTQSLDTGVRTVIAGAPSTSQASYIMQNLDQGAYLILLILGLIGMLICLNPQNRTPGRMAIVLTLLILTVLPYGFQFLNLQTILPGRWYLFSNLPLSILAMIALVSFCSMLKYNLKTLPILLVVIVIIFLSITNSAANDDSPLIYNGSQRIGYTESEITAVKTLTIAIAGKVATDLYYGISWPRIVEYYGLTFPNKDQALKGNSNILVERNYYLAHPEWNKLYTQELSWINMYNDSNAKVNVVQYLKQDPLIYSSGNVAAYVTNTMR